MKRKIISMLMAMVILLTTVDLSVFASEAATAESGNEVRSAVEEVADGSEEIDEAVVEICKTRGGNENEAKQKKYI